MGEGTRGPEDPQRPSRLDPADLRDAFWFGGKLAAAALVVAVLLRVITDNPDLAVGAYFVIAGVGVGYHVVRRATRGQPGG